MTTGSNGADLAKAKRGTPLVEMRDISIAFGGIKAVDHATIDLYPGEVVGLLGHNGAGKTTLIKVLSGAYQRDAGAIYINGELADINNPRDAKAQGIETIYQNLALADNLDAAANLYIGRELKTKFGTLDDVAMEAATRGVMGRLNPNFRRFKEPVKALSGGQRQSVAIARAINFNARILIMDEPTSVLTPQEVEELFKTLRRLASEGVSILSISHKLHEIVALCERATILRGGRVVATCDPRQETPRSMGEMMIGSDLRDPARGQTSVEGPVRITVRDLSLPKPDDFGVALDGITLNVKGGEIFGIAGVAGNGQNELLEALCGERLSHANDTIMVDQSPVGRLGPTERRKIGLCAVPEERNGHAAIGNFSLADNATLTARTRMGFEAQGFIDQDGASQFAADVIKTFAVKT